MKDPRSRFTIDHDERLRRFFSREEAGQVGLRSNMGAQLEAHAVLGRHAAKRSGVNGVSAEDVHPPRIIDYQNRFARIESSMTGRALNLIPEEQCSVLKAHYAPRPPSAFSGVLLLQPHAGVALLLYGEAELREICRAARAGKVADRAAARKAIEKRRDGAEKKLEQAKTSFAGCFDRVKRELERHEAAKRVAEDREWTRQLTSEDD